jgi:RHS repeat-associated protein
VAATDEEGEVTQFTYEGESADRLLAVQLPSPDGVAPGPETRYAYDEVGNRISQTDALGRLTVFNYDELNRMSQVTIPDGEILRLEYDAIGNLVTRTDYDGLSVTYEYDSMNRVVRKNIPGGGAVDYRYTETGQRRETEDDRGITTAVYDSRDRLISTTQPDTGEIQYLYDANGNMLRMTSPNGVSNYTYDALNRLTSLEADGDVIGYGYDAAGRLARITSANDVDADYTHDSRGRTTGIVYTDALGDTMESYAYDYTAAGRAERIEEFDGSVVTFGYDGMGRLTAEQRTGGSAFVRSHVYDAVGNRTSTVVDGVTTSFTYDPNDRLVSADTTTFLYDAKGNMIQRTAPGGTIDYSWTPENRLAEVDDGVNVTMFGYDADGIRVSRQTGADTTRFLVDGKNPTGFPQVIEETSGTGLLLSEFQYGPKLAAANVGGNRIFYHDDALRDTRLLTDNSGAVTDSFDYSAYGELAGSTGSTDQPYQYNGEQFDPAVDSYYLRQRYYDPGIGRFLSRDSFMGDPNLPPSLNPYLFGNSDPVSFHDPSGNFSLISISFSSVIQGTLRAINVGQKASTICRVKGRIALFQAIWTLRSLGQFVGASHEIGAGTGSLTGATPGFSLKTKLWSNQFAKNSLEEVTLEEKWTPPTTFQTELAAKWKRTSSSDTAKVNATKDISTGVWTVEGGFEKEVPLADIKFCGFVKIGDINIGIETAFSTTPATPLSGSAKGYLKLGAVFIGSLKVTVVKLGF